MVRRAAARKRYLFWLGLTVALGLVSRKLPLGFYAWDKALGDALYAAMVYLGWALLAPGTRKDRRALGALGLCAAVELFQLTGLPMQVAHTPLRWVLGTTFAWEDLVYYALGTAGISLLDVARERSIPSSPHEGVPG